MKAKRATPPTNESGVTAWYVVDRPLLGRRGADDIVCGPLEDVAAAQAAREALEQSERYSDANLWIKPMREHTLSKDCWCEPRVEQSRQKLVSDGSDGERVEVLDAPLQRLLAKVDPGGFTRELGIAYRTGWCDGLTEFWNGVEKS